MIYNNKQKMKTILFVFMTVCFVAALSTNSKPNNLNQYIQMNATSMQLALSQYFAFKSIEDKQWYAFAIIKASDKYQFMNFQVHLKTVSKENGKESHSKVQCESNHNDLHMCFLAYNQIDIQKQNLKIEMIFLEPAQLQLKVEINTVRMMNLSSELTLKRQQNTFSNIIRVDMRQFKQKFDYITFYLREDFIVDQYRNTRQFLASKQLTPPDAYQFSKFSFKLWDVVEGIIFSPEELQQVEYLTFVFGITDQNTYTFISQLHKDHETKQLSLSSIEYQMLKKSKQYHINLPTLSSPAQYHLLRIKYNNLHNSAILLNVKVNKIQIKQQQLNRVVKQFDLTNFDDVAYLWLNNTIKELQFTIWANNLFVYTIDIIKIDTNTLALDERMFWSDYLKQNQTQYVYLTIDTKTAEEKENFIVYFYANDTKNDIKIKYCVKETVGKCDEIMKDSNVTKKIIGAPLIQGKRSQKRQLVSYQFQNIVITKTQIKQNLYRSIVIVQVTSFINNLYYGVFWNHQNLVLPLKVNQLTKGYLNQKQVQTYSFTVYDASKISFARIHYLASGADFYIFGATAYISQVNLESFYQSPQKKTFPFDFTLTFTELKDFTTYFIYIFSENANQYQLTLTYGYDLDGNASHSISYLTMGENSRNELMLQSGQILFVQVRFSYEIAILSFQTNEHLKYCILDTANLPNSHKDMLKSQYCKTLLIHDVQWISQYNKMGKRYIGIQNQNKWQTKITLTAINEYLKCQYGQIGKLTYTNNAARTQNQAKEFCIYFSITHKAQIQIVIDIENPKLHGIALPQIRIGETETLIMRTKTMTISAEDIDTFCQQEYEWCILQIMIKKDKQHSLNQFTIPVIVQYTDRPAMLLEGIAHHSTLAKSQTKYFKYPLTESDLIATIYSSDFQSINMMAKIVLSNQKLTYLQPNQYQNTSFKATSQGYFYPSIMQIQEKDIKAVCKGNCYLLLSVFADENNQNMAKTSITVQIIQRKTILKDGSLIEKYLQKQSVGVFLYQNLIQGNNLLFFTSSSNKDCIIMDLFRYENNKINGTFLAVGDDEVQFMNATKGWYQLNVIALDNCYFVAQVSSTKKRIKQLVIGYANTFQIDSGQKMYYYFHNEDFQKLKIISNIDLDHLGQLNIRLMPISEKQINQFMKFLNNQPNKITTNKISYEWSDINHIEVHSSDKKFCKNCYYMIEIQSNKHIEGSLNIPTSLSNLLHFNGYISYDILDKDQSFIWLLDGQAKQYSLVIKLIAGSIKIQLDVNKDNKKQIRFLKYNPNKPQENNVTFSNFTQNYYYSIHLTLKITALQNSDYSIYSYKKTQQNSQSPQILQEGRPNYLLIYNQQPQTCFSGKVGAETEQFVMSDLKYKYISNDNYNDLINKNLIIEAKVDNKVVQIKQENFTNTLLLSFKTNRIIGTNQNFSICFSWKAKEQFTFTANLIFIGNINYFPQNQQIFFKRPINLTFMSQGAGYIELDECSSVSTVTLSSTLHEITGVNSKIRQMRTGNNLIMFYRNGSAYVHVQTHDFVKLRWRNIHKQTSNGYGYVLYQPSTFRILYDQKTDIFSLLIQPLSPSKNEEGKDHKGNIVSLTYHIYAAKEFRQLSQAINCQKGIYMYWYKPVENASIFNEVSYTINNLQDIRNLFGEKVQYLLLTVVAEINIIWPINNVSQNYRFYYPNQQLLLTQLDRTNQLAKDDKGKDRQSSYSILEIIGIVILLIILVLVIYGLIILGKFMKNKYFRPQNFTEFDDVGSISMGKKDDKEMQIKQSGASYLPPK